MMDDNTRKELASLKTKYYTGFFRMYPNHLDGFAAKVFLLGVESERKRKGCR